MIAGKISQTLGSQSGKPSGVGGWIAGLGIKQSARLAKKRKVLGIDHSIYMVARAWARYAVATENRASSRRTSCGICCRPAKDAAFSSDRGFRNRGFQRVRPSELAPHRLDQYSPRATSALRHSICHPANRWKPSTPIRNGFDWPCRRVRAASIVGRESSM